MPVLPTAVNKKYAGARYAKCIKAYETPVLMDSPHCVQNTGYLYVSDICGLQNYFVTPATKPKKVQGLGQYQYMGNAG